MAAQIFTPTNDAEFATVIAYYLGNGTLPPIPSGYSHANIELHENGLGLTRSRIGTWDVSSVEDMKRMFANKNTFN